MFAVKNGAGSYTRTSNVVSVVHKLPVVRVSDYDCSHKVHMITTRPGICTVQVFPQVKSIGLGFR